MIGQFIGNYRVVRQIGQGGMGSVFEAIHEQIKRRAAIKILNDLYSRDAEMTQRFFNEALAVNVIQHPSIVGVFESGRLPDGRAFIVMEYLEGESLYKRLSRTGALPQAEALQIARQVASALEAAHVKGIIHRDLKSDNVMLVPDPEVEGKQRAKILDFGIAKVAAQHQVNAVQTKDGVVMGTPEYMSPEQWMSSNVVDPKADVYALGIMLFEMLAARYPFVGNPNKLMMMHLYEAPPPLIDIMPSAARELSNLIDTMLAKTRGTRPTMQQVAAQLARIQERNTAAAAPTAMFYQRPVAVGAAAGAAAAFRQPQVATPSEATAMVIDMRQRLGVASGPAEGHQLHRQLAPVSPVPPANLTKRRAAVVIAVCCVVAAALLVFILR